MIINLGIINMRYKMETRPIGIGDTALITIGPNTIRTSIVDLEGDVIYIDNQGTTSLIINNGKDWRVYGLDEEHTIVFEAKTELSDLPTDMMTKILFRLNYEEITKMCATNRMYCDNDDFWRLRISNDYPTLGHVTPISLGYKNHREMYEKFFDGGLNKKKANIAARAGNLPVLQRLALMTPPIFPDRQGANSAAAGGYDEVLEWMEKLTPPVHMIDDKGIKGAVEGGHINILQKNIDGVIKADTATLDVLVPQPINSRGFENNHRYPYDIYIEYAAVSGRTDVLEWLHGMGCNLSSMFDFAVDAGRLDVLQWSETLYPPVLPTVSAAKYAAFDLDVPILEWLEKRGILPNYKTANGLVLRGRREHNQLILLEYLKVLKWLEKRGILPDRDVVLKSGNSTFINWFESR